jgi:hypothetical protein
MLQRNSQEKPIEVRTLRRILGYNALMSDFPHWLASVLQSGDSVQSLQSLLHPTDHEAVLKILRTHFRQSLLDVAGPELEWVEDVAVASAEVLSQCCWLLATSSPDVPEVQLPEPKSAAEHLSVDVCGKFWPALYRRASSRGDDDPMAQYLEKLLKAWPLSGVLAGLTTSPTSSLDFFGHSGLQLLYAERFLLHPHPSWLPPPGLPWQQAERVFALADKPLPVRPLAHLAEEAL